MCYFYQYYYENLYNILHSYDKTNHHYYDQLPYHSNTLYKDVPLENPRPQ